MVGEQLRQNSKELFNSKICWMRPDSLFHVKVGLVVKVTVKLKTLNMLNFRHIEAVLEEGGHFLGIYRKVQLKPSKWVKLPKPDADCEDERPVEALMVLKYGGVLHLVGRKQAEKLGRFFWNNMYLDEGRVKMSAAAFAKDLDLERQLTPILVSLVSKDSLMLDGLEDASEMEEAKAKLHEIVTSEEKTLNGNMSGGPSWMVDGAGVPDNASQLLHSLINDKENNCKSEGYLVVFVRSIFLM